MAKLSNKGLAGIALALSLITAVLVYNFLRESSQKQVSVELATVITAKTDIPPKTRITADMVQEARIPAEYIQPGAVRELSKSVGVMTREAIVGGEQVLERRLLVAGKEAGFTGLIPAGKRALTVGVTEVTGVAGLLKAGDSVDAIVTFDQQVAGDNVSQLLLQNLLVLAVNRESDAVPEKDARKEVAKDTGVTKLATVTLAISPSDAAKVALAEEKGKLRFALRPFLPEEGTAVQRPVTPSDIVGVLKSPIQPDKEPAKPADTSPQAPAAPSADAKKLTSIPVIRGTKVE